MFSDKYIKIKTYDIYKLITAAENKHGVIDKNTFEFLRINKVNTLHRCGSI